MPAKIVTTPRKRRATSTAPSFPWPVAACVIVLIAGFAALRILRKSETTPSAEPDKPLAVAAQTDQPLETNLNVVADGDVVTQAHARAGARLRNLGERSGEARDIGLSHTGGVTRVVRSGTGIAPGEVLARRDPIFTTQMENFIFRYASSARHPIMLMPRFSADAEAELRKILSTDIVVYDDDDDETVADKEAVAALKQEILAAISEGHSAADILNHMREDNNARVRNRVKMQRELNTLMKSNMVDEAMAYFNEANSRLSEDCLPPLVFDESNFPSKVQKQGE